MTQIEIYLGGSLIDISDEVSFRFNYQFSDISDIQAKRTSFSKPFSIPATKRNKLVFDNLEDLQIKSNYQILKKADCVVKIDGIEMITGWAKIEQIRIKDHDANVSAYYEITISDEVNNIFTSLKNKSLKSLDLSDFNHLFTLHNVINSWNTSIKYKGSDTPVREGFGYDYPLVDLGGKWSKPNNTDWYLTGFRPWMAAKTIVDYIFLEEGATYEGFFDTDYFKKMIISPDSSGGQKLSAEEMRLRQFNVGLLSGYTFSGTYSTRAGAPYSDPNYSFTTTYRTLDYFNPPNPGDTGIAGAGTVSPQFNAPFESFASMHRLTYDEFQTFSNEVWHNGVLYTGTASLKKRVPFKVKVQQNGVSYQDNSNQFDSNTFSYKSNNHSVENISITIPSMLRVHLPNYTNGSSLPGSGAPGNGYWPNSGVEPDPATGGYDNSGLYQSGQGVVYGIYRTWCQRAAGNLEILDSRVENYFFEPQNGAYTKYASQDPTLWRERGYWIYEYVPPTPIPDDTTEFLLYPGDEIFVEFSYIVNLDNDKDKWMFDNCFAAVIHLSTGVDEFKNSPFDNYFLEGNLIDMSRMMPNVSRLDFLSSIFSMFNLYIVADKVKKNHYIIKTRDTFFDFSRATDWTKKLDRTAFDKKPIPLTTRKSWLLAYKKDIDYFNATYDADAGKTWGEYKIDIESNLVEGEQKLNLIFSPSPMLLDSTSNRRVSRIFTWDGASKESVSYNPRILFKNYIVHSNLGVDNFNILWSGGTYSATRHSTATHLDNPYSPQFDLNFYYNEAPGFYYVNHNLPNRNLYNLFWRNTLENIIDPDGYMLVGFFNLHLLDIINFDFRKPIFIDGQYFYVNKVVDWNPDRKLTKCELIKIKNYNPGDFLGKIDIERPTKGQIKIGDAETPVGTIKTVKSVRNPDTGIISENNNGGKVKSPVVVVGSDNSINDGGSVIVVGGSNTIGNSTGGIVIGNDIKINSGLDFNIQGQNIDAGNIISSSVIGSSMSISSLSGSEVRGENIQINQKVINSNVLGSNIVLNNGGFIGPMPLDVSYASQSITDNLTPKLDSVFLVGKDLQLQNKIYESGLITGRWYMPSGPEIFDSGDGSVEIKTNAFTFSFGTFSIIPGGRVVSRKDVFISATSTPQTIQTRDEDYLINIQHTVQWTGATNLGDIYLPQAAQYGGREVVYKITSTYSMPGTYFKVSSAVDTIDYKTDYYLSADKLESATFVSNGVDNWHLVSGSKTPKSEGIGVFYSTQNQIISTASFPQRIDLDTTDISDGIYITGSRIYIDEPASYKMSVSLLIENFSNNIEDVIFFLKFNGATYSNSGHYTTIRERKSTSLPSEIYLNYHFIGKSLSPGDYVELWWQATSLDVSLAYTAASGGLPASPSVIVNINKISK